MAGRTLGAALAALMLGGMAAAQDVAPVEALGRTVAQICLIDDGVEILLLRRGADGRLAGLGSWADWEVSEGDDRLALLKDGNVLQIGADGSMAALDGAVTPMSCVEGTDHLLDAIATAAGTDGASLLASVAEAGRLPGLLDALTARGDYVTRRLTEARGHLSAAQRELNRRRTVIDRLGEQRDDLEAQLDQALQQIAALEGPPTYAGTSDRELGTQLANEAALREEADRQVASLGAQVEERNHQIGTLQALLEVAMEADEANHAHITSLEAELDTALAQVGALARRTAELEEAERQSLAGSAARLARESVEP